MKAIATLVLVGALVRVLWAMFVFEGAVKKLGKPRRDLCSICKLTPYNVTFIRSAGSARICDACAFRVLRKGHGGWVVKIIVDGDAKVKSHARRP
jgi:hypothetical protein